MDDAKRRALIKQQAAKKKQDPTSGSSNPSMKRQLEKPDRQVKKPRYVTGLPAVHEPVTVKLPPKLGVGKGKGLMTKPDPVQEKAPILLREDSQYALSQVTSIIKAEDYEDLGNHATEAMGETCLFNLTQVGIRHFFHLPILT